MGLLLLRNQLIDTASPIKEISGKCPSVIDSVHCMNKAIVCAGNNVDHISEAILATCWYLTIRWFGNKKWRTSDLTLTVTKFLFIHRNSAELCSEDTRFKCRLPILQIMEWRIMMRESLIWKDRRKQLRMTWETELNWLRIQTNGGLFEHRNGPSGSIISGVST
jgi:hypothetical protein